MFSALRYGKTDCFYTTFAWKLSKSTGFVYFSTKKHQTEKKTVL